MFLSELIITILGLIFFIALIVGICKLIIFIGNKFPAPEPRPSTQNDIIVAVIIILLALGKF